MTTGSDIQLAIQMSEETLQRLNYRPSLRDHFAMAALTGMISTSAAPWLAPDIHGVETLTAKAAYKLADAMLEARKKEGA